MLTLLHVFLRSIVLYLLFTLPAVAEPLVYIYSAFLAIVFGLAGGIVFIGLYALVSTSKLAVQLKFSLLFLFVLLGVSVSYLLIGFTNAADDLWGFNPFLVFPVIAVIAGWCSLFMSKKDICKTFQVNQKNVPLLLKP